MASALFGIAPSHSVCETATGEVAFPVLATLVTEVALLS